MEEYRYDNDTILRAKFRTQINLQCEPPQNYSAIHTLLSDSNQSPKKIDEKNWDQ